MEKKKHFNGEKVRMDMTESLRLNPEKRLCPMYDSETIAKYSVAAPGEMGFRVVDDFVEEHIQ